MNSFVRKRWRNQARHVCERSIPRALSDNCDDRSVSSARDHAATLASSSTQHYNPPSNYHRGVGCGVWYHTVASTSDPEVEVRIRLLLRRNATCMARRLIVFVMGDPSLLEGSTAKQPPPPPPPPPASHRPAGRADGTAGSARKRRRRKTRKLHKTRRRKAATARAASGQVDVERAQSKLQLRRSELISSMHDLLHEDAQTVSQPETNSRRDQGDVDTSSTVNKSAAASLQDTSCGDSPAALDGTRRRRRARGGGRTRPSKDPASPAYGAPGAVTDARGVKRRRRRHKRRVNRRRDDLASRELIRMSAEMRDFVRQRTVELDQERRQQHARTFCHSDGTGRRKDTGRRRRLPEVGNTTSVRAHLTGAGHTTTSNALQLHDAGVVARRANDASSMDNTIGSTKVAEAQGQQRTLRGAGFATPDLVHDARVISKQRDVSEWLGSPNNDTSDGSATAPLERQHQQPRRRSKKNASGAHGMDNLAQASSGARARREAVKQARAGRDRQGATHAPQRAAHPRGAASGPHPAQPTISPPRESWGWGRRERDDGNAPSDDGSADSDEDVWNVGAFIGTTPTAVVALKPTARAFSRRPPDDGLSSLSRSLGRAPFGM